MTTGASLTLIHSNAHNERQAINVALRTGADVAGFNEVGKRTRFLRDKAGYRLHVPKPSDGPRNISQSSATLVREAFPYKGEVFQQVSQQVDRFARVAPDRWLVVSCFQRHGLPFAHFNLHCNASPVALRGDNPNHPVVREYQEGMDWLEALLRAYDSMGYIRLLSGDLNLNDMDDDPPWSPYPMLRAAGMATWAPWIDAVGWDRKALTLPKTNRRVIPKTRLGSDHDALWAKFVVRG